ncbi:NAD(P)H-dependent oxidoreductase [Eubacteriales bacterium OttesenSCG-928-M02]|nr:NAD(P)H-dependent oxidoreductase [Eubacteriales bacterium OttesenSCG-928-M02]
MAEKHIGIFVGSTRRESFNQLVADYLKNGLEEAFTVSFIQMDDLPLFNQDYDDDGTTPESWTRFREQVAGLDGYLFVTPEYNRSYTPLLKNALDIGSRPPGKGVWGKKPGGVISVSPGKQGGFGATHHLRQVLAFLDIYVMGQPEAYMGGIADAITEEGRLDGRTRGFLDKYTEGFIAWVNRF